MSRLRAKLAVLALCLMSGNFALAADDLSHRQIFSTLRTQHPRLIILPDDIARIKESVKKDPIEKKLFDVLKTRADQMLTEQMPEASSRNADALASSRLALKHLTTLAGMFRLTGDPKYAKRAKEEMLEIASFSNWPGHFLCVAEMTAAMSLGYDWLFEELSPDDRTTIRKAIIRNGLTPGLAQYEDGARWTTAATNWNFVCNGGLILGALVVADEEPQVSEKTLTQCLESVPIALKTFAPDGGWPEGPGYWAYGTRYLTYLLAGLQSALGDDWNLAAKPGVADTGFFRIYSEGPLGLSFNFADSETEVPRGAQMFWLARRFHQPVFAGAELQISERFPEMFHLLFYNSEHPTPAEAHLPLNKIFSGVNVAFFRSKWADSEAFYVGCKGGENRWSHAHADLGSFVFDAAGYRWAEDLGPDDYELPGYFGDQHLSYYRLQTQAHNTLTIGEENQPKDAHAEIVRSSSSGKHPFAILNLSSAYDSRFSEIKRGISLLDGKQLLIQDEFQSQTKNPIKEVIWHLHTRAHVRIVEGGRKALLQQGEGANKVTLKVEILSCPAAAFTVEQVKAPQGQAQQPAVSDLTIKIEAPGADRLTRLAVAFSIDELHSPFVKPLEQW